MIVWSWKTRLGLLGATVVLGVFFWWLFFLRGFGTVVLATGQAGGTYRVIGEGFAQYAEENDSRFAIETLSSRGTSENLKLLKEGHADFAIVQSGQEESEGVRVVAKLYTEVLHVLVRKEAGDGFVPVLSGQKICLGEEGSGSRTVSRDLLVHFGVENYEEVMLPPREALSALQKREVAAVFLMAGLQSEVIRSAVRSGEFRLIGLQSASGGLVARYPYLREAKIPAMTYSCPKEKEGAIPGLEVATVGVPSLLVGREDVSKETVYEVTKALFASRNKLSR